MSYIPQWFEDPAYGLRMLLDELEYQSTRQARRERFMAALVSRGDAWGPASAAAMAEELLVASDALDAARRAGLGEEV